MLYFLSSSFIHIQKNSTDSTVSLPYLSLIYPIINDISIFTIVSLYIDSNLFVLIISWRYFRKTIKFLSNNLEED